MRQQASGGPRAPEEPAASTRTGSRTGGGPPIDAHRSAAAEVRRRARAARRCAPLRARGTGLAGRDPLIPAQRTARPSTFSLTAAEVRAERARLLALGWTRAEVARVLDLAQERAR